MDHTTRGLKRLKKAIQQIRREIVFYLMVHRLRKIAEAANSIGAYSVLAEVRFLNNAIRSTMDEDRPTS